MHHHLVARERAMDEIRHLTAQDPFVAAWALLYALEAHDLAVVNEIACGAREIAAQRVSEGVQRARALMHERFGGKPPWHAG